jgi:excisionase family DNA binding protein
MIELMTLEEIADYLRVTEKTVYRMLKKGTIPAIRVGKGWRFEKHTIEEWLKKKTIGTKAKILVVDDETNIQLLFSETLSELGHQVMLAGNGTEGLELVKLNDFDLAFIDLKMPGLDGVELFHQIRILKPNLTVIIITGYPDSDLMARALEQGPFGVMNKPFGETDIINATNNFLRFSV